MSTQNDIAEHLDLSLRHTQKLIQDGKLPATRGRGGYNIDECRIAYVRYLRGVATGQVKVNPNDDTEDVDRSYSDLLEREKYREKKRENDLKEQLVAPVSVLTDALHQSANQIIPILESLPLMIKRSWPSIGGDQILMVKKAIAECRNIIAESELKID